MPTPRLTAAEKVRSEIDALFADPDRELGEVLEHVAQLSVRLVFQAALEAEVTEFLGRDRYARGERARDGLRNGYAPTTIKTTAGRSPWPARRSAARWRRSARGCSASA